MKNFTQHQDNFVEFDIESPIEAITVLLELRRRKFVSYRGQRDYTWDLGPHGIWDDNWDKKYENIIEKEIYKLLFEKDDSRKKVLDDLIRTLEDEEKKKIQQQFEKTLGEDEQSLEKRQIKILNDIVMKFFTGKDFQQNEIAFQQKAFWYSKYIRTILEKKLNQFIKFAQMKNEISHDDNWWDKTVFAQHYELKTLLLDWTSNPLVALYFAVENISLQISANCNRINCKCTDADVQDGCKNGIRGAVFALKVDDKNHKAENTQSRWHDYNDACVNFKNGENCPFWIMINPPYNNDRIVQQSGKISYHPSVVDHKLIFDKDGKKDCRIRKNEILIQMNISETIGNRLTKDIRLALGVMNIHHGSLFPDYTGYSSFICKEWSDIARPYIENEKMFDLTGEDILLNSDIKENGDYYKFKAFLNQMEKTKKGY